MVRTPYNYRTWYAEMLGLGGTGGFHLFLMKDREQQNVEYYNYMHFWDVTEEDLYKQLEELFIEIEWNY